MTGMQYSEEFGFLPSNTPEQNRAALQNAADRGGEIYIGDAGEYSISGTVRLGGDTTLRFGAGVYIKRFHAQGGDGPLFVNRGAYTREYDRHIGIYGLKLVTGGVDIGRQEIVGINAQLSFFYIKDLVIVDFECLDLGRNGFGIQMCTFENVLLENLRIAGMKDAVHFGPGRRFSLRHGLFCTFDDPIALNAHDYATSNPQMGWIEDGIIEDCYDLDQPDTTGFFCRILAGSWLDWRRGMVIRNSDTVVYGGRMYRARMNADGAEYTSLTPPSHESGEAVLDGIRWVMTQDDNVIYNCGCRNIHFRDIFLQKHRRTAFCFHFDDDNYSHSVYPGSTPPVQTGITFENVIQSAPVENIFRATTPVGSIKIINSFIGGGNICFARRAVPGLEYDDAEVTMTGVTFRGDVHLSAEDGRRANIRIAASSTEPGATVTADDGCAVDADIPLGTRS